MSSYQQRARVRSDNMWKGSKAGSPVSVKSMTNILQNVKREIGPDKIRDLVIAEVGKQAIQWAEDLARHLWQNREEIFKALKAGIEKVTNLARTFVNWLKGWIAWLTGYGSKKEDSKTSGSSIHGKKNPEQAPPKTYIQHEESDPEEEWDWEM